ncbi:MAG: hypothetical protein JWN37_637 [Candidatus Nomurabacteria bacterium]|nr:hypothetical protein [Candidatus Nomurabacteria bacterium]
MSKRVPIHEGVEIPVPLPLVERMAEYLEKYPARQNIVRRIHDTLRREGKRYFAIVLKTDLETIRALKGNGGWQGLMRELVGIKKWLVPKKKRKARRKAKKK